MSVYDTIASSYFITQVYTNFLDFILKDTDVIMEQVMMNLFTYYRTIYGYP